jgi:cell division protein FtsB
LYSGSKRAILPRDAGGFAVKKKTKSPDSASSSTPRRRRHAVQYLLIFVGCVLVVDALVGDKGFLAMMKVRQEYQTLEQSLATAKSANAQLREQARRLREDPDAIEDIARRELGLMKPGEKLFIVKDIGPADQKRP